MIVYIQLLGSYMERLELYIQIAKVVMMAVFLTVFLAIVLLGKLTITIK